MQSIPNHFTRLKTRAYYTRNITNVELNTFKIFKFNIGGLIQILQFLYEHCNFHLINLDLDYALLKKGDTFKFYKYDECSIIIQISH